jgi:hypothetical protein
MGVWTDRRMDGRTDGMESCVRPLLQQLSRRWTSFNYTNTRSNPKRRAATGSRSGGWVGRGRRDGVAKKENGGCNTHTPIYLAPH